MDTAKKNKLNLDDQIERMRDEGLGGGRIIEEEDKEKLKQPKTERKSATSLEDKPNGNMVEDMNELKKAAPRFTRLSDRRPTSCLCICVRR